VIFRDNGNYLSEISGKALCLAVICFHICESVNCAAKQIFKFYPKLVNMPDLVICDIILNNLIT